MNDRDRDIEIMQDLTLLVRAAQKEKERWKATNSSLREKYDDEYYNGEYDWGWMFKHIWEPYWRISRRLTCEVDYYDPDTTYEADIMAHYNAAIETVGIVPDTSDEDDEDKWWRDVLRDIDYPNKYPED